MFVRCECSSVQSARCSACAVVCARLRSAASYQLELVVLEVVVLLRDADAGAGLQLVDLPLEQLLCELVQLQVKLVALADQLQARGVHLVHAGPVARLLPHKVAQLAPAEKVLHHDDALVEPLRQAHEPEPLQVRLHASNARTNALVAARYCTCVCGPGSFACTNQNTRTQK